MLHKEMVGLGLLFFVLWIFVASSGTERVQRICAPVDWTGNVILSAAALASPESQVPLAKTMGKVVYGCEYIFWRLFYQSEYLEWVAANQGVGLPPNGAPPVDPSGAEAAPAAAKEGEAASKPEEKDEDIVRTPIPPAEGADSENVVLKRRVVE